jgi:glycosyltransferase involved in cell wall biosynthesis
MPDVGHSRAVIPPVGEDVTRPLWSVMIPTYECAHYLRETLASVLVQDPGPDVMQIEVVDDHSTKDDPAAVVNELGHGRVAFHRQSQNVGVTRNFATCVQRARGRLVHLLHGDDLVRPGFYRALQRGFEARDTVGAAFCRHIFADPRGHWQSVSPLERAESGVLANALVRLAAEQRIMTPSIVVRRAVYERLGGFDERLLCAEDWEMWVRIAAAYDVWYEPEPLAVYRMHRNSNTGRHLRSGEDMRYTRDAIAMFAAYLPPAVAGAITRRARETYASAALDTATAMCDERETTAVLNQVKEALQFSRSPRVVARVARVAARWVASRMRRPHASAHA